MEIASESISILVKGIADALRRVTEREVTIEGPDGTLLAWTEAIKPEPAIAPGPATLEQAVTVLAMESFRLRSVAQAELAVWGDLVSELLDGHQTARGRLHAQTLGYDIDHLHRGVVVKRSDAKVGSLLPAVRRAAQRFDRGINLMASRAAGVVLLVDHDLPWAAFAAAVAEENSGVHKVGVGGLRGPDEVHRSVEEAEMALDLTECLGKYDLVAIFEDLGVWRLLAAHSDPSSLRDFVREWIGTLIDYDGSHGSDLVTTLATFLDGDGAFEATARKLLIHRSTLRYRLGRIEKLGGHNLGDADHRFDLALACRAWIILNASGG